MCRPSFGPQSLKDPTDNFQKETAETLEEDSAEIRSPPEARLLSPIPAVA